MVLTFTPGPSLPPLPHWEIISFDTLVHGVIFAVLVFLMANAFKHSEQNSIFSTYAIPIATALSMVYGSLIEVIQRYIPGRSFDYYDILSNTIGCMIGILFLLAQRLARSSSSHS
jgi:VanZ family protein